MKKVLFMVAFIIVAMMANGQNDTTATQYVVNKIFPDTLNTSDMKFVMEIKSRTEAVLQKIKDLKLDFDISGDTVYNEEAMDGYGVQLSNLYNLLLNQYATSDTINVYVIGGKHYLENDLISLEERRTSIKNQWDELVAKWGEERVRQHKQGQAIYNEWLQLQGYITQLQSQ
jgi:hypothetical protein